jgi:hypothetical protein
MEERVLISKVAAILLLFSACDIPGKIELVNKSTTTAYYRVYSENDSGKLDTSSIEISGIEGNNQVSILFGFGHRWTDESINAYVSPIEKIELISQTDTIILNSNTELFSYFRNKRRGVFKRKIKITLH